MPLNPATLAQKLIAIDDESTAPRDIPSTAQAWADAWWAFASGMTYFNPASLEVAKGLAVSAFLPIITPGLVFGPPGTFFLALDGAMSAAWLAAGNMTTLTPPVQVLAPVPGTLGGMVLPQVPTWLAAKDKRLPRTQLAAAIYGWSLTVQAIGPSGPIGPIS